MKPPRRGENFPGGAAAFLCGFSRAIAQLRGMEKNKEQSVF